MISNLAEFNREVSQFARSIPEKVTELQRKIVLEALGRIVQKTPVDTGRARGNWQVTFEAASQQVLTDTDPQGSATVEKALAILAGLPAFSVVHITNNLDYILFLEEGSSSQAPQGMVAVTVQELMEMFP